MKETIYCLHCDEEKEYYLQKEKRVVNVKGDVFEVTLNVAYCAFCHEKVFPDSVGKENDLIVYDAYRKRHNLLTSEEIKAIRKKRNMSQRELAAFIKCGEKNIARYENGTIQDRVFDYLIRMVGDDNCYNALKQLNEKTFSTKRP